MFFKRLIPVLLALTVFVSCGAQSMPQNDYAPTDNASQSEITAATEAPGADDTSGEIAKTSDETSNEVYESTEGEEPPENAESSESAGAEDYSGETPAEPTDSTESGEAGLNAAKTNLPERGEYYYDVENVVLYIVLYGELPPNYITKDEARSLGWEGGSVEDFLEGAAIGGDRFGNREGLLPEKKGRKYTECDIDTDGYYSRGSRRLIFSDDGLFFYTADHYETFTEVTVTEDYEVIW